jgi:predicted anti-sigma-YlaC factor YlaD
METSYERHDSDGEGHLTDEQFTDLLMGGRSAWVQAHLQECAACREEAERVAGAIGDFSAQSILWAERRAAARPMWTAERESVVAWLLRPQAWVGAALTIALAVGTGMTLHQEHTRAAQQAMASAPAAVKVRAEAAKAQAGATKMQAEATVSPTTLKADNALLTAIDGELRADESTPASLYGLDADSSGAATKSAKRTIN